MVEWIEKREDSTRTISGEFSKSSDWMLRFVEEVAAVSV